MLQPHPDTPPTQLCLCDRCGRKMQVHATDGEWDEHLTIAFRSGYFSIFGDGNLVECDLCQHCIKKLLGKYLRITQDDPGRPQHKPQAVHFHAFQDYQLHKRQMLPEGGEQPDDTEEQERQATLQNILKGIRDDHE